ncbi:FtsX-like permease family protein [candidate division KSB1 bacterium]
MGKKKHRPPGVLRFLLFLFSLEEEQTQIMGDFEEEYAIITGQKGRFSAVRWYIIQILISVWPFIKTSFRRNTLMFRNYFITSLRNIKRYKGYSFVNIFGLTVGLTCCIFIFLYINYETSYDSYHEDIDRIYRVISTVNSQTGETRYAGTSHQITPYINENLGHLAAAARATPWYDCHIKIGDKMFKEPKNDIPAADPEIFKILSFDFICGDPNTALTEPFTIVISEKAAEKYFGSEDPMGKTLNIDSEDYEVTAVVKDLPGNTVFRFEILRSWENVDPSQLYPHWLGNYHLTFIKLAPGVNPEMFAGLIEEAVISNSAERIEITNREYSANLQPISRAHLYSGELIFERSILGNIHYIYLFSGIGIFILLIASFNFVNLTTARSCSRAGEVGIRKVNGALRKQLFYQFMGESLIITTIAFVLALILVFALLGSFNDLAELKIEYSMILSPDFFLVMFFAVLALGVAAGSYPAVLLSSFKPISVLKGSVYSRTKAGRLRKILVVGQFVLSIVLISGVLLFYRQLNFMKNESLGFKKEQKLIINMENAGYWGGNFFAVKSEFTGYPSISSASFSSRVPGRPIPNFSAWPSGQQKTNSHWMQYLEVDGDFISQYGLEFLAGKGVTDEEIYGLRRGNPVVLNEKAVSVFGWFSPEEAINKAMRDDEPVSVVKGVVRDFHFEGLQKEIGPLVIIFRNRYQFLTLEIGTENIDGTLSFVEGKYKELFPGMIFEYFFLDSDFNRQYRSEEQTARIFGLFTFLGIFIACLGLIGLAAYIAEQRTKEIGIRKVLGASSENIVRLLTKEFIYLVLAANIIAVPVSYVLIDRWFRNFAYRIEFGYGTFVLAGLIAVLIAAGSVCYQAFRAANRNPVESLRYE